MRLPSRIKIPASRNDGGHLLRFGNATGDGRRDGVPSSAIFYLVAQHAVALKSGRVLGILSQIRNQEGD